MDKLVEHGIRMLEIVEGENDYFRNDAKRQADIARAVYDTILRVQALERKADRKTENNSEIPNNCEPKICDTCRYYNSNIPCGSTPSACKKADKFAEEFVDGLKKLKPKDEPRTEEHCNTCRHKDECEGATYEYKNTEWWCLAYAPIDEPQTDCPWR